MKYNKDDEFIWRVTADQLIAARPLLEPHKFKIPNTNVCNEYYIIHLISYIKEYQISLVEQFNKELCG